MRTLFPPAGGDDPFDLDNYCRQVVELHQGDWQAALSYFKHRSEACDVEMTLARNHKPEEIERALRRAADRYHGVAPQD